MSKIFKVMMIAAVAGVLSATPQFDVIVGGGSSAEARGGRPLTPVSVAGAGRRTVRRCAAGVYDC